MGTFPLYRWAGGYFGFVRMGRIYGADGSYLGWIDDSGKAWRADGSYLGELTDENYILRRKDMPSIPDRPEKSVPAPQTPLPVRPDRKPRNPWPDKVDALDHLLDE